MSVKEALAELDRTDVSLVQAMLVDAPEWQQFVDAVMVSVEAARKTLNSITTEEVEAALVAFDEAEEWSSRPPVAMRAALDAFIRERFGS